jgi:hypothetical protein
MLHKSPTPGGGSMDRHRAGAQARVASEHPRDGPGSRPITSIPHAVNTPRKNSSVNLDQYLRIIEYIKLINIQYLEECYE